MGVPVERNRPWGNVLSRHRPEVPYRTVRDFRPVRRVGGRPLPEKPGGACPAVRCCGTPLSPVPRPALLAGRGTAYRAALCPARSGRE